MPPDFYRNLTTTYPLTYNGTVSSVPTHAGIVGEVVFNYEDSTTYMYTGQNWIPISAEYEGVTRLDMTERWNLKCRIPELPQGPYTYIMKFPFGKHDILIEMTFHDTGDVCALHRIIEWGFEHVQSLVKVLEDGTTKDLYKTEDKMLYYRLKKVNLDELFS